MKYLTKKTFVLVLFLSIFMNSYSQDKDNKWMIGFGVNAVDFYPSNINGMVSEKGEPTQWFDQFFNLNGHYNYISAPSKISLGRYISESFNADFSLSFNKIEKLGSIKLEETWSYLAVDANVNYNIKKIIGDTKWFDPYAVGGVGFNIKEDNNAISFNSGGGTKFWLTNKFGIKIQTVYKHFFGDGSYPHFQHSASLVYKFGAYDEDNDGVYDKDDKCPSIFGLKEFEGCPDTDGDGVIDSEDKCPRVKGKVILKGCPDTDGDGIADINDRCPRIKGLAKHNGCPDTDGDGLIDMRDRCPRAAGPLSNNGCPEPDADGDGVPDKIDKCKFEPGTISNNGCPEFRKAELEAKLTELARNILFVSGTNNYYKKYEPQLNEIAGLMKKYKMLKFQIQGHTDDVGSEELNYKLSLERVNKILGYLVSKGVDQLNLNVKGFGETKPIAPNNTKEGRAKNRRVEIKILN